MNDRSFSRLGEKLAESRRRRGFTQVGLASRAGITRSALQNIERGEAKRLTPTIRTLARLLGWDDRALDSVLQGGEPSYDDEQVEHPKDLPTRTLADLASGILIDTMGIELPHAQVTIVVRGHREARPRDMAKALDEWHSLQKRISQRHP